MYLKLQCTFKGRTRDQEVEGYVPLSCNDSGQVVHTHVPLSPSSIIWYWPTDGDVLWLGRWPRYWRKLTSITCGLKPGFHYTSWRPELTARVDGWPVSITCQHRPVHNFDGPTTRLVETGLYCLETGISSCHNADLKHETACTYTFYYFTTEVSKRTADGFPGEVSIVTDTLATSAEWVDSGTFTTYCAWYIGQDTPRFIYTQRVAITFTAVLGSSTTTIDELTTRLTTAIDGLKVKVTVNIDLYSASSWEPHL